MQKKPINQEDFETILLEMCSRVGEDYDFLKESEFFKEKEWYCRYSWSEDDQEDFAKWLSSFLVSKGYCSKKKYRNQPPGHHLAWKILLDYGWTTVKHRP